MSETPTIKTTAIETTSETRLQQLVELQTRLLNTTSQLPDAPGINVDGSEHSQALAQDCLETILKGVSILVKGNSAFLSSSGQIKFQFDHELRLANRELFLSVARQARKTLKQNYGYSVSWKSWLSDFGCEYGLEFALGIKTRMGFLQWRRFFFGRSLLVEFPIETRIPRSPFYS